MPMPEEPTPNYTMAAMKAQAEEIVRAWGAPGSQEAEVMAAASVGRAGFALANLVLHWFRQQEWEARTSLMKPRVLDLAGVLPDWLRERLEAAGAHVEYDTTPLLESRQPERRLPEGRPGWLGEWQPYPCGRCGREVDDVDPHECKARSDA